MILRLAASQKRPRWSSNLKTRLAKTGAYARQYRISASALFRCFYNRNGSRPQFLTATLQISLLNARCKWERSDNRDFWH